jgi:hypothetical protein
MALAGKGSLQGAAVIVVAGQQVDRHRQRRQKRGELPVFVGAAVVGEVAGGDQQVGHARHRADLLHAAREHRCRVDPAVGELARGDDVRIADLADEHGRPMAPAGAAASVVDSAPRRTRLLAPPRAGSAGRALGAGCRPPERQDGGTRARPAGRRRPARCARMQHPPQARQLLALAPQCRRQTGAVGQRFETARDTLRRRRARRARSQRLRELAHCGERGHQQGVGRSGAVHGSLQTGTILI